MEPVRAADDLLVARMRLHRLDAHDDRLLHCARDDDAAPLLARAPPCDTRTRSVGDRLAALGRLALGARAQPALAPGLPLRLGRALGSGGLGRRLDLGGRRLLGRRLLGGGLLGRRFLGRRFLGRRLLGRRLLGLLRRYLGNDLRFDRSLLGLLLPRALWLLLGLVGRLTDGLRLDRSLLGLLLRRALRLLFGHGCLTGLSLELSLVPHRQDARDLAFRELQARGVLERAGRRLEAEVEQLLTPLCELVLKLVVGHVPQLSSSQRDPPPVSRTSS